MTPQQPKSKEEILEDALGSYNYHELSSVRVNILIAMESYASQQMGCGRWVKQDLKELDASFEYLFKMEGVKDAGHRWIEFSDKWNAFKKRLTESPCECQQLGELVEVCKMAMKEILNNETDPKTAAGGALLFLTHKEPSAETVAWAKEAIEKHKAALSSDKEIKK